MAVKKNFKVNQGLEVADSATINGGLTVAGITYPKTDGTSDDVIKTDGAGNLVFGKLSIRDLTDVNLLSLRDGGLLVYDSDQQKWVANTDLDNDNQSINGGSF